MKRSLLILLALAASAGAALAQDKWPSQPIRIVNAFAAGGATDITLRTAAEELRDILGVNVIVENKPGAGGIIAIEEVSRKTCGRLHPSRRPELHVERPADDETEAQLRLRRQVHDRLARGRGAALDDPRPQGARHQGLEIVCRLFQGEPRQDPLCEPRCPDRAASRHDASRQSARRGLDAYAAEGRRRHPEGPLQRGREHRSPEHRGRSAAPQERRGVRCRYDGQRAHQEPTPMSRRSKMSGSRAWATRCSMPSGRRPERRPRS